MARHPAHFPFGPNAPLTPEEAARIGISWRSTDFGGVMKPTYGIRTSAGSEDSLLVLARSAIARDPRAMLSHQSGLEFIGAAVPARLQWLHRDPSMRDLTPSRTGMHPADPGRPSYFLTEEDRSRVFLTVPLTASGGRTRDTRRFRSDRAQEIWVYGVPVSSPGYMCCNVAPLVSEREHVQVIDSLIGPWTNYRTSIPELSAELEQLDGVRGVTAARKALARADPRSASPAETLLRLMILDSGLPTPELNVEICNKRTHGITVIVDIFFRAARLVVEYEGRQHLTDPRQWDLDIDRGQAILSMGLRHMRVNNSHLRKPDETVRRIADLIADPTLAA